MISLQDDESAGRLFLEIPVSKKWWFFCSSLNF